MNATLDDYTHVAGPDVIGQLRQIAKCLKGASVLHINSTKEGGGVAEILNRLVPLQQELGLNAQWEVIEGNQSFFQCTKAFHNALQGDNIEIPQALFDAYEGTTRKQAEKLRDVLTDADVVFVHDPQPAALIQHFPKRKNHWVWRCHIDVSRPHRAIWKYLRPFVQKYDASIWHMAAFAQPVEHTQYLIPPSIDPLSEKNIALSEKELAKVAEQFCIDCKRPVILQVSRFDRFKDPIGVISAYRMVKKYLPIQLILAGGTASDDPEGRQMLDQVKTAGNGDPDIHILLLPPDAHRTINALQRIADIVLQKSLKEGFGLTVTEAMWKKKPVIGGDVGGIRLQIINHRTGFLVNTPEGAAHRIRYLLRHKNIMQEIGGNSQKMVQENFLLTRHLRDYMTLMLGVINKSNDRIEL